ncbi:1142_t:CDS:2, partial [Gigaspora margarita]
NTNKMNLELYSDLAKVDGMGFPLAYMLLFTATAINDGAHMNIITYFFDKLHNLEINLVFVLTDKDSVQILAAKTIWPEAHIQLCFWYLKRAIKRMLGLKKMPKTICYSATQANAEFSFVDINFYPEIISQQHIGFTFCPTDHHNHILNLMIKHFNQHPYIPAANMQHYFSDQIREFAVKEMYTYYKNNNLKWPHVDLLVWILTERLLLQYIIKMQQLELKYQTRAIALWHSAFKRNWKTYSKNTLSGSPYATDTKMWTCSCLGYLNSRFLLCKHLVQSVHPLKPNFFNKVTRYRSHLSGERNMELNDKTNEELAKALQEYKESENNIVDNIIVEELNKT